MLLALGATLAVTLLWLSGAIGSRPGEGGRDPLIRPAAAGGNESELTHLGPDVARRREGSASRPVRVLELVVCNAEGEGISADVHFAPAREIRDELELEALRGAPEELARVLEYGHQLPSDRAGRVRVPFGADLLLVASTAEQLGWMLVQSAELGDGLRVHRKLHLRPRYRVTAQVKDTLGRPVSGVPIELRASEVIPWSSPLPGAKPEAPARAFVGSTDVHGSVRIASPHLRLGAVAKLGNWDGQLLVAGASPGFEMSATVTWEGGHDVSAELRLPAHGEVEVRGLAPSIPDANGLSNEVFLIGKEGSVLAKRLSHAGRAVFSPVGLGKTFHVLSAHGVHEVAGPRRSGERVVWDLRARELGSITVAIEDAKGRPVDANDFELEIGTRATGAFYCARSFPGESALLVKSVPPALSYAAELRAHSGPLAGLRYRCSLRGPSKAGATASSSIRLPPPPKPSEAVRGREAWPILQLSMPSVVVPPGPTYVHVVFERDGTTMSARCMLDRAGRARVRVVPWWAGRVVMLERIERIPMPGDARAPQEPIRCSRPCLVGSPGTWMPGIRDGMLAFVRIRSRDPFFEWKSGDFRVEVEHLSRESDDWQVVPSELLGTERDTYMVLGDVPPGLLRLRVRSGLGGASEAVVPFRRGETVQATLVSGTK